LKKPNTEDIFHDLFIPQQPCEHDPAPVWEAWRSTLRTSFSTAWTRYKKNPIDHSLSRDLKHGWHLPYLMQIDELTWGRWNYWYQCMTCDPTQLPKDPIPQIIFSEAQQVPRKEVEKWLNAVPDYGSWVGWSSSENFLYFIDWMLYGFGCPLVKTLPKEPSPGASMRLYQLVDLWPLMLWPNDYLGDILADSGYGKRQGFYPTPMNVVALMTQMTMGDAQQNAKSSATDMRLKTVMDPCVGTGRFSLAASNYSLCLYAVDIDVLMVKATLLNMYLYAPWGARSIPQSGDLSNGIRHGDVLTMSQETTREIETAGNAIQAQGSELEQENKYRYSPVKLGKSSHNKTTLSTKQGELF
jgi:hypothetical protein